MDEVEPGTVWAFSRWDDRKREYQNVEIANSLLELVAKTMHTGYGYAGKTIFAIRRNNGGEWESVAKIFPHMNQGPRISLHKGVSIDVDDAEGSPVDTVPIMVCPICDERNHSAPNCPELDEEQEDKYIPLK